ncbi:unnamed protein product [Citrullus colocynthis]|uniref:Uncharacterized protein n=1 Tax=Citrullus colocynthis TaxID=252529 RepID=A0ABP0Y971_9ROSI
MRIGSDESAPIFKKIRSNRNPKISQTQSHSQFTSFFLLIRFPLCFCVSRLVRHCIIIEVPTASSSLYLSIGGIRKVNRM